MNGGEWVLRVTGRAWWVGDNFPAMKEVWIEHRRAHPSKEEKARLVAECCRPGASLHVVARRARVKSDNLRHWVRLAGRIGEVNRPGVGPAPAFVPLLLEEADRAPGAEERRRRGCGASGCRWAGHAGHGSGGVLGALARIDPDTALRIVLATRPVHFQKRHDGLAAAVERDLGLDPYSGVAVVFRCKGRNDRIKILWWEGASLMVVHKRLEKGRFHWPPVHHGAMYLSRRKFERLFEGLDWRRMLHPRTIRPMRARGAAGAAGL